MDSAGYSNPLYPAGVMADGTVWFAGTHDTETRKSR